jgi:sphingolipid 4-desaturase/C4-monooxygenase
MPSSPRVFSRSSAQEPHYGRSKAILEAHPELRHLIGHNPHTFWFIVALVTLQLAIAWSVRTAPWWVVITVAYVAGAFVTHALIMLMHECTHGLVFRKRAPNILAGIFANLPTVVPSAVSVQRYHLKHHAYQGVVELDVDMPNQWEVALLGGTRFGKALWLALVPVFQALRPMWIREVTWLTRWTVFNLVVVLVADAAIFLAWGPKGLGYLALGLLFGLGLHPLGGRWIQEHFVLRPPQETYSYYGPLNLLSFNIGYHNEHHDFPSVPWNRLPDIRRLAPEWYDSLASYRSWTGLAVRFIFDPNVSLAARMGRTERGALDAAERPGLA